MSTRSRIGMVQPDGTVKSVYCHFDGYPSGVGITLLKNYTDPEKVKKLIDLGDLSVVGEEVEPAEGQKHDFENPIKGITIAYGRDRGEDGTEARVNKSREGYFTSDLEEYGYLFTEDNTWMFMGGMHNEPVLLTEEICNND